MTQVVLALVLGTLFGLGTFLVLRRDVVRVVWGVTIVSQSANVYLVTMGGLGGGAPILGHGPPENPAAVTDPLVQALVLTAIVIGFGTTALALVLTFRVYEEHGTIDVYELGRDGIGDFHQATPETDNGPDVDGDAEAVADGGAEAVADGGAEAVPVAGAADSAGAAGDDAAGAADDDAAGAAGDDSAGAADDDSAGAAGDDAAGAAGDDAAGAAGDDVASEEVVR